MSVNKSPRPQRQNPKRIQKPVRDCWFPKIRGTADELAQAQRNAQAAGKTLSAYLRDLALNAPAVSVKSSSVDIEALQELGETRRQFSGVANNLNRQTKAFHIHSEVDIQRFHNVVDLCEAGLKKIDTVLARLIK